jgi:hypothetical protein
MIDYKVIRARGHEARLGRNIGNSCSGDRKGRDPDRCQESGPLGEDEFAESLAAYPRKCQDIPEIPSEAVP